MSILIPVNSDGNREILVNVGEGGVYRFRTYFTSGQADGWYLDIRNTAGDPLLLGRRIVPGCPNLLKGQGDNFRNIQLAAVVLYGSERTPDALGNGTYLVWFNPGEENPFLLGDAMIDVPYNQWAFHQDASNRLFESDGNGNVRLEGVVLAGATDRLASLGATGNIRIEPNSTAGTNNVYMKIGKNGNMVMKG